jgi:hypothetical protein
MQHEDWMPSSTWRDVAAAWYSAGLFMLPIAVLSWCPPPF